jgi:predicted NBD/HSP70 family sugar kinase
VAELVAGCGRDVKSFLYLFVDTFVGGGLVIHSHLHGGVHGNAGAVASMPMGTASEGSHTQKLPEQLLVHASLWELEQRFAAKQLDPTAAYDERALQAPYAAETQAWVARAASALAQSVVSGTAFLDMDAVVIDGSFSRDLLQLLLAQTQAALQRYSWEGLWHPTVMAGSIGSDARALGGALLPLHANFAPDRDVFLKA